ncbi:MAG: DUF4340 domain-containing protein [Bryobacterales bacterium]|nr:DUF4340 domain-containing protein [Bryobacteraceae bacterium]MDW8356010.1 DUF4340 domain-containing protein [Bryobacterales bacterium]
MRIRGLLVALVVLAALGGAVYWSNKAKKAEETKPSPDAPPKILSIPEDQFQQIEIRKAAAQPVVLRKGGDGKWEMTSPEPLPVDQDAVSSMVSTLSSLEASRLVEEKTSDWATFGLASPSVEIAITKKDGKVQKVLIGDESPASGAYFARLEGDPRVFTIASYNKTTIDKSARDLRDKRLLTFDSDKLTRVELTAKNQTIEFGKNARNEWQIIRPHPMRADGGQVEELIRRLKDARMDAYATPEDDKKAAAAFPKAQPLAKVRVTDASGTQELEVRVETDKDKNKTYYAKSSVVAGAYKITSYTAEGLDKGLEDFRNKKLFDFGWTDPSKIEIRDGDRRFSWEKSADKWMAAGKELESASVQSVVDKLRDLAAIKFPDKGFTTPFFEVTVTSDNGKRVEKVQIARQGNSYFARRENEPAIYELDGKAVEELQKAAREVKERPPSKEPKKS